MFGVQRSITAEKSQKSNYNMQRKGVGKTAVLLTFFLIIMILTPVVAIFGQPDTIPEFVPNGLTTAEWKSIQDAIVHDGAEITHQNFLIQSLAVDPWDQIAKFTASDKSAYDNFGHSVAVSDDTIVVGAHNDSDNGSGSGSIYVFERGLGWNGGSVNQVAKLLASDGGVNDGFGGEVAISEEIIVTGADSYDKYGDCSGAAYVFEKGDGWRDGSSNQKAILTASDAVAGDDFGFSVAVSGETVVIGAYNNDDNGTSSGSAYVFERGTGWHNGSGNQVAKMLAADAAIGDQFGRAVAISGETVLIGAMGDGDKGARSGSAYVFVKGLNWGDGSVNQTAKLIAEDGAANDWFGSALAIRGEMLVVGAHGNDTQGENSGSAYLFEKGLGWNDGSGNQTAKLMAADGDENDFFARSVAIHENMVVIGATGDDDLGDASGSAYVFNKGDGWVDGSNNQVSKILSGDGARHEYFGNYVAVGEGIVLIGATVDDTFGAAYLFTPPQAQISIDDVTLLEGNEGITSFNFTISRSNNFHPFSVDFDVISDTASLIDSDYVANSGSITFAKNDAFTHQISIQVNGDNRLESDETFFVYLNNVIGEAAIVDEVGQGTIENDDVTGVAIVHLNGETAVDDSNSEGNHSSSISFTIGSNDANYSGLIFPDVAISITDNDKFLAFLPLIVSR